MKPTGAGRERAQRLRPLHILLAEDSLVNQKLVVTLVGKRRHAVTVAGNGRAALAAVASQSFDLVLMDVQMPEMDGLEATAAIRVRERQTGGHVPIVAMTAHALKGDRERCLEAGMDEYISKPIHSRQLLETIERAVGSRRARDVAGRPPSEPSDGLERSPQGGQGDRKLLGTIVARRLGRIAPPDDGDPRGDRLGRPTRRFAWQPTPSRARSSILAPPRVCELAHQLERMGQEGDLRAGPDVVNCLETELARLTDMLARHKEGRK